MRNIIALIFLFVLAGCYNDRSCEYSSCECPCDPCARTCPRPRDCGPTIAQLSRIEKTDCGWGCSDFFPKLQRKGVQVIEIGENAIIILPADRFFEVNCATIREDSYNTLNYLVCLLHRYGCTPLYISGHTDNVASRCFDFWLSDARAQSIQAYFWIRGIQFRRMCTTGCADCMPIANQVTVLGNAANRRIEIRIRRTGCF